VLSAQNSPDLRGSLGGSQGSRKRPAIIRQRYDMIQNRRGPVTPDPKRPSVVPSLKLEKIVPSDDSDDDYEEQPLTAPTPVKKFPSPPLPPQCRHPHHA
jgi:hypothetical protein